MLVLEGLPGATLGHSLRNDKPLPCAGAPGAHRPDRLRPLSRRGRPGRGGRLLRRQCELIRAVAPETAERVSRLEEALAPREPQPIESIHGDLHEGNVLVRGAGVSGLLDIDDAGVGERVDDLGQLAGRIWVRATSATRARLAYADELLRCFDQVVDPLELRRRAGVTLVARGDSPFRNQVDGWQNATRRRLDLAERWVAERCPRRAS